MLKLFGIGGFRELCVAQFNQRHAALKKMSLATDIPDQRLQRAHCLECRFKRPKIQELTIF